MDFKPKQRGPAPVKIFTPEEIEEIRHTITPVEQIPERHGIINGLGVIMTKSRWRLKINVRDGK